MKKQKYSLYVKKVFDKDDISLYISFGSILTGFLCGVLMYIYTDDSIKNKISDFFISFHTDFSDKSTIEIISGFLLYGIIYYFSMLLLGSSIFGNVLSPMLTTVKASGITVLICAFYCEYSLKGLEYTLLVFSPGKSILIVAMLIMTKTCIDMSGEIKAYTKNNQSEIIKTYLLKCCALLPFFVFSWITDLLCVKIFSGLFDF